MPNQQSPVPTSEKPPPVLCLGESMLLLTADTGAIEDSSHVGIHVGGAESNVARGLAHLGHAVEWFSRLGSDPFGNIVHNFLAKAGIDVSSVQRDRQRPTGVYFKDSIAGKSRVYYYRAGSAASAMSPEDIGAMSLPGRRLCHLSGITAALSTTANELLQRLVVDRGPGSAKVSFDVNYRPGLWPVAEAAPRLLELARASDIVVVGRDEAQTLWSTGTAEEVRSLIPQPEHLVVKDAEVGATHFSGGQSEFVPSLEVDVVEPVGAGDAFAAGFLSGQLQDFDIARSLRLGHVMAGFTLQDVSDLPELPPLEKLLALSQLEGTQWNEVRLTESYLSRTPPVMELIGNRHDN